MLGFAKRIFVGALFSALLFFSLPSTSQAKTPAAPPSLDALARELQTPELLEKYMRKNFLYVEDRALFGQEEYWQTAEEMAFRKKGDCEDFATFAQAILKRNGYQTFLVSVYWELDAHTVVVFEREGTWGLFDLDQLSYLKRGSLKEIGDRIQNNWSYLGLMRKEGRLGLISRKFWAHRLGKTDLSLLTPKSVSAR